jgi:hypothetical protein
MIFLLRSVDKQQRCCMLWGPGRRRNENNMDLFDQTVQLSRYAKKDQTLCLKIHWSSTSCSIMYLWGFLSYRTAYAVGWRLFR